MDKALKQRLVGASVLIALAVVVLPMLLGGRPESSTPEPENIELPQQPADLSFETRRYPIGETAGKNQEPEDGTESVPQLPAPKIPATTELSEVDEPVSIEDDSAEIEEHLDEALTGLDDLDGSDIAEPDAVPTPVETGVTEMLEPKPTVLNTGRYLVQVASFGAVDNANRLSGNLKKGGYSVMTDSIQSDVGTLHRVRVGPFDTEAEAQEAAVALGKSISGVKPRVMDLQPEQASQVTTPDDPLVRWVVQVGSFSSEANAENLVASLRLKGMSAYQETIRSGGSEIYRVRIGPFLVRDQAIKTEREVSESLSVSAVVMSAD